jgi:hypothetical protein
MIIESADPAPKIALTKFQPNATKSQFNPPITRRMNATIWSAFMVYCWYKDTPFDLSNTPLSIALRPTLFFGLVGPHARLTRVGKKTLLLGNDWPDLVGFEKAIKLILFEGLFLHKRIRQLFEGRFLGF